MTRQLLCLLAAAALAGPSAPAQPQRPPAAGPRPAEPGAPTVQCTGTVTDTAGNPVPGATVEYWRAADGNYPPADWALAKQITTAADGAYAFEAARDNGFLLGRKPGLAPAWQMLNPWLDTAREGQKLVLSLPGALAGTVTDESNQPVAGAEVFVRAAFREWMLPNGARTMNYLTGKPARDLFAARTDAAGHFRLENFPTDARAVLAVAWPGKVLRLSPSDLSNPESAAWRAGDNDLKLVLEPAGSVEGTVVCEDGNQPPPLARLTLQPDQPASVSAAAFEPVASRADGTFRISNVAAGDYHVRAVFGTNSPAEWVAAMVPVTVAAGQTTRGVQLTASRGACLEVAVLGQADRQPKARIRVSAYNAQFQSSAESGRDGRARLRLLPGDYQLSASSGGLPQSQSPATAAAGKTNRVELEFTGPKTITGLVRTPAGGPAADVSVQLISSFGLGPENRRTDANGRFELEWNTRSFPGQDGTTACVLARDLDHNLAAAQEVDEDTGALELKLAPALTLAGRAEAEGKPVKEVTAQLVFWLGNRGSWLAGGAGSNKVGQYEIPALPPGRKYGVIVSAPGYGQKQMQNLEISADPGRQELDPVELKPANSKLAGQVFDADDHPVAGCFVNLNGDNQPSAHVRTDREGRFTFDHVCEGTLQLNANNQRSFGSIAAEGGDTNVVLRLGNNMGSAPGTRAHQLKGVVTDADGQPAPGARLAVFPGYNGTHWFKTGAAGEYSLTWSLQPWQTRNGGAYIVARDPARNLAAVEELPEETTNLDLKLKPAFTLTGLVKNESGAPLPGLQAGLWFKAGSSYSSLEDEAKSVLAGDRYVFTCLPVDGQYSVWASAKGYGKSERQVMGDSETNRLELDPLVLKPTDRFIAGQVLKDDDKPASGVNVNLNGAGQPDGQMTTDSQGRFHFQVCAGEINLFAFSPYGGGGNAQATVQAGDTNIVMNLRAYSTGFRQAPARAALKGSALPDLTAVNLPADAAPAGQAVLLCLFDAAQRPSRHGVQVLAQQAAGLREKNVAVLALQSAVISDQAFNDWKSTATLPFPVGRVTEKSEKNKWASSATALPWLILADANHRVVAEGFALDELDAQIQKMTDHAAGH